MSNPFSRRQPGKLSERPGPSGRGAGMVACLFGGGAAVTLAISLAAAAGPGVASATVRPDKATDYGSFTLSGPVSGAIVPLASTCDASTSAADVEFSWFGKVTTLKGVSSQSIVSMELDLQGSSYGRKGTLKNTDGNPPFFTFNATTKSGLPLAWQSVSGSYSTTRQGVSGTLSVVMDQADGKPGRLDVKGSWQQCRRGGNI
ncbi:MAG TPA: hypothetical protein VMF65_14990 [Acidimicrobiales bacterium]|nr:hypothetical protein [Acidimicrobiales bacterium]